MGYGHRHFFPGLARLNRPVTWFILAAMPGCIPMATVGSEPESRPREVTIKPAAESRADPLPVSQPPFLNPVPAALPVADRLFTQTGQLTPPTVASPILKSAEARSIPDARHHEAAPSDLNTLLQQIESRNFENLPPEAAKAAAHRLREMARRLEQRQPLTVTRVALARSVDANGTCHPWPAGHLFRPGRGDEPGDRVLTYLELEHLKYHARDGRNECHFTVSLELRDRTTVKQTMSFPARVVRQRADSDSHWLTLCFHLPGKLNPGPHSLVVVVEQKDEPAPRIARKSVDFLVALAQIPYKPPPLG